MFVRVKNIRKKDKVYRYAYMVENVWRKRKKEAKQKVKGYLGRVHKLEREEGKDFFEHHNITDLEGYIKKSDKSNIISDLIKWELVRHGFYEKDGKMVKDEFIFNTHSRKFNKNIVLEMNEGFLCEETINGLLMGKFEGDEREAGMKLARAFVEAGLKVPENVFVGVFQKVIS